MKLRAPMFALLIALLASCTDSTPALHGHVYFASGNYLGMLNLSDGSTNIISNLGNEWIDQVSSYRDGELLLSTVVTREGRDVERVTFIRVDTLEVAPLYTGRLARYLPDVETLVYDDGFRLQAVSLSDTVESDGPIDLAGRNSVTEILPLSDGGVLFETRSEGKFGIVHYDVVARETSVKTDLSDLCRLQGAVWIASKRQLVCSRRDGSGYVLASLDGVELASLDISGDANSRVLAFLQDQQLLLFTETRQGVLGGRPKTAVWIYDLRDGTRYRLLNHQHLGETVAYRPI